jgi:hypothetical protein
MELLVSLAFLMFLFALARSVARRSRRSYPSHGPSHAGGTSHGRGYGYRLRHSEDDDWWDEERRRRDEEEKEDRLRQLDDDWWDEERWRRDEEEEEDRLRQLDDDWWDEERWRRDEEEEDGSQSP